MSGLASSRSLGFRSHSFELLSSLIPIVTTMAGNTTLTIIKPDAFTAGKAGKIIAHLEAAGFKVRAARVLHMTDKEAGAFYEVHRERPFYLSLVAFMTSGPCMPMVLQDRKST